MPAPSTGWPSDLVRIPSASNLDVCARCEHFWRHGTWVSQDQDHCAPILWTQDAFDRLSSHDLDRYLAIVASGAWCCFYEPLTVETAGRWRGPGVCLRVPIVPETTESPVMGQVSQQFWTIGYGGRRPADFVALLARKGVRHIVDVRLRPDRASLGCYTWSKDAAKGIRHLFEQNGIAYTWRPELGNLFVDFSDWRERYLRLMERSGDLLLVQILEIQGAFCLLCAEQDVQGCHREIVANELVRRGFTLQAHL